MCATHLFNEDCYYSMKTIYLMKYHSNEDCAIVRNQIHNKCIYSLTTDLRENDCKEFILILEVS